MKKPSRFLIITACLAAFVSGLSSLSAKEEPKMSPGSIHVAKKTKAGDLPALAKITLEAATKAALAVAPGKVSEAKLEVEEGYLVYSVKIVGDNKSVMELEVDAGDGKVLSVSKEMEDEDHGKKDDDDDEDDEKDDRKDKGDRRKHRD